MKIIVEKAHLRAALRLVSRAVSKRPTLPITEQVHMEVRGDYLQLTGTNLEVTLSAVIKGSGGEPGAIVVPPKPLAATLGATPGRVELSSISAPLSLVVASVNQSSTLHGALSDEFPPTPRPGLDAGAVVLEARDIAQGVQRVIHAVAKDGTQLILTAVCMDVWLSGGVKMAATDSYRMAIQEYAPASEAEPTRLLFPAASARLLGILIHELVPETISTSYIISKNGQPTMAIFQMIPTRGALGIKKMSLTGALAMGTYPNYSHSVPDSYSTEVVVNREELLEAIDEAKEIALESSGIIRLSTSGNDSLEVVARAVETGSYSRTIGATVIGPAGKTAVNYSYLVDMLKALNGIEQLVLRMTSPSAQMTWTSPEAPGYLEVLMPMFMRP